MLSEVDSDYLNNVSVFLTKFSVKATNPYRANFRCPYCGDSKKSESKARGWILEKSSNLLFYCHNCGKSTNFLNFLQDNFSSLGVEYRKKKILENMQKNDNKINGLQQEKKNKSIRYTLKNCVRISSLPHWHKAKQYIISRQIPSYQHFRIYYTKDFVSFVQHYDKTKMENMTPHERIVLPMYDFKNRLIGFQGRSLDNKYTRYITIMLDENQPKIFGIEQVNFNKKYYIVEGPIDSFFLPNCIAMAGASFNINAVLNHENAVVIFDNEPRNKEICGRIENAIKDKLNVVIWPKDIEQKDLNDMVIHGIKNIREIVDQNTYSEIKAILKFNDWRKV